MVIRGTSAPGLIRTAMEEYGFILLFITNATLWSILSLLGTAG